MSHENWLVAGLASVVVLIQSLVIAVTWLLGWHLLAMTTLVFVLSYPLIWIAYSTYQFWCRAIMQLTTYTQILKEGETNLRFKRQHSNNLLLALQSEINALASRNIVKKSKEQSLDSLLTKILDTWPVPVCLFDEEYKLTYRNSAMNEQIQQPMLLGELAFSLGFQLNNNHFSHTKFGRKWQCQTISYRHQDELHWLFTAVDVTQLLNKNESLTQQNLIRVLSHELRNSLTPMSSMADTLLCSDTLDEQQTRLVLTRIQQRSNRLLSFIFEYSKLTQLPAPCSTWFSFKDIVDEATSMIDETGCDITQLGATQCYGDSDQLAQVMINLLKNSQEACEQPITKISISLYFQNEEQFIEVVDNGAGFSNLNNVLTPFYTTKQNGSGIGLSLCAEIVHNHGGKIVVENNSDSGAKITLSWPIGGG